MTPEAIRAQLSDPAALICTLYGEARDEPIEAIIACGNVIRNRVHADLGRDGKPDWWGESFAGVCLKKLQFSCWWEKNANTRAVYTLAEGLLRNEPLGTGNLLSELQWIAHGLIEGALRDNTRQADHYLTKWLYEGPNCPSWAKGKVPVARIGAHVFLRLSQ